MTTQFKSLLQVLDFFKEESTCINYLAKSRWGDTPSCPHCGNVGAYVTNRGYKCKAKECHKKFTVTTGTIFENTKISLRIWFAAMYLCTAHKKGISSLQLSRDLNITQKTAWFVLHRIREMLKENAPELLSGTVEADETYIGGARKNKSKSKRANLQGTGNIDKKPVFGLLERGGRVVTYVVNEANGNTLKPIIRENLAKDAMLVTDGFGAYTNLNKEYVHKIINHHLDEYVVDGFHTNTIEGFWSLLKRGIIGIYHNVSPKHLHRYCNEFGYRYNTRKVLDGIRFEDAIKQVNHGRITYNTLISK